MDVSSCVKENGRTSLLPLRENSGCQQFLSASLLQWATADIMEIKDILKSQFLLRISHFLMWYAREAGEILRYVHVLDDKNTAI